jgi:hypothetical protein
VLGFVWAGAALQRVQLSPDQVSSSLFPHFSSVLPLFFTCYLSNKDSYLI